MTKNRGHFKRVRGYMLKLLAYEHPGALDSSLLYISLDNLGYPISEDEFASHLAYLEHKDKGYVQLEKRGEGDLEIVMVVITPKGLDLLDRYTPECDPGVDVSRL